MRYMRYICLLYMPQICMLCACYICVLILLYMCQATCYICELSLCPHTSSMYVSSCYCYVCVLILLYVCYICILILCQASCAACPRTPIYVSSYCYICVLILLYMCPHTPISVSSYCARQAARRIGRVGWRSGWIRLQRYDLQTRTRRQGVHCKCSVCPRAHAKRPRRLHLAARQREEIDE
jgi:hypothetical protein